MALFTSPIWWPGRNLFLDSLDHDLEHGSNSIEAEADTELSTDSLSSGSSSGSWTLWSVQPFELSSSTGAGPRRAARRTGPPALLEPAAAGPGGGGTAGDEKTLMIRNISLRFAVRDVAAVLDINGLAGTFDAIFLPKSPVRSANLGYGFVNFRHTSDANECIRVLHGFKFGITDETADVLGIRVPEGPLGFSHSTKLCEVVPADDQGIRFFLRHGRRAGKSPGKYRDALFLAGDAWAILSATNDVPTYTRKRRGDRKAMCF
mmetsp:Transcript_63301/g.180016  ORF Transcript_63301/g.180016 Transcript_63301/m.180016 type:complete len:262 (-) Transcript_63301:51-836(-)